MAAICLGYNFRGKRKGICGEEIQRFEPNLPLSEANFKFEPMTRDR
jgi:hypothetical protein